MPDGSHSTIMAQLDGPRAVALRRQGGRPRDHLLMTGGRLHPAVATPVRMNRPTADEAAHRGVQLSRRGGQRLPPGGMAPLSGFHGSKEMMQP